MRKSMKQQRLELEQTLDRLNSLAARVRTVDPSIGAIVVSGYKTSSFTLAAKEGSYQNTELAIFFRVEELERSLIRLAEANPMSKEAIQAAIEKVNEERNAARRKRMELEVLAKRLNHPAALMRQQQLMEEAWNLMLQDGCYYKIRQWINLLGGLPSEVGVDLMGRHNIDFVRQQDEDVSFAEFHWISGEFHHRFTRNFDETYRHYGEYPDQFFVVELRTLYTDNARNERRKILKEQIFPLLDEIRKAGFRSNRGRELIQRAKDLIATWAVLRPWPPENMKKKKRRRNPINTKRADQLSLL